MKFSKKLGRTHKFPIHSCHQHLTPYTTEQNGWQESCHLPCTPATVSRPDIIDSLKLQQEIKILIQQSKILLQEYAKANIFFEKAK